MFRSLSLFFCLSLFITSSLLCISPELTKAQEAPANQTGTIIETMDASGYTYLHLDTGQEKLWVAIPSTVVKKGEKVTTLAGLPMQDFYSKTLDKTFPTIIFSPGLEGQDRKSPHTSSPKKESTSSSFSDAVKSESGKTATPAPAQTTGGSTAAAVPFADSKVKKAEGENGYSVEEVFKQAHELDGKTVKIRGKVVKFSPNIMGKNWIHIQDGSGDPMKNTHDLVITTAGQAKPDDIIIIEGKVASQKDFGFGYKYDALVEEASIIQ